MKKFITGLGITLLSVSILAGCVNTEKTMDVEETVDLVETVANVEVLEYVAKPGTFAYDSQNYIYHGDFDALGYVTTQTMDEGFCTENCKTYTYASFNILETPNASIEKYTEENTGNSFIGNMSIGIGCVAEEIIWRMAGSDESGTQKYTDSMESSKKLLNSTEKEPVTVNLKRDIFTGGGGAPDCYSHFSKIEVMN